MELLEFQERFVRGVYAETEGERLVRLAGLSVARGNGKSALLAGLSLAHLLGPMKEPHGECYAAALDREQAGVLYRMVRAYIEATPWMAAAVNIRDWHKSIEVEADRSTWTALTSDARKAHGLAPSFWIADEVAQWRSRELWDNLKTGMAKRKSALGVTISTQAADDMHFWSTDPRRRAGALASTCNSTRRPTTAHWTIGTAWAAANPALGEFLNEDEFADAAGMAMRSPSFEPAFRLLNLNQRVAAEGRFINPAEWEANAEPFDAIELEGERCFGGLDLSSTRDLTALALWFPGQRGGCSPGTSVPRDTIAERVERDRVPYDRNGRKRGGSRRRRAGQPIASPLRASSPTFAAGTTCRASPSIAGGSRTWAKLLSDEGIDLPMVEFVPGFKSYAAAVDAFERAVLERRMQHNGSPILKWQAGNIIVETDPAGNRKPAKNKSIDKHRRAWSSAIMACGLAATDEGPKVYRGAGLEWV